MVPLGACRIDPNRRLVYYLLIPATTRNVLWSQFHYVRAARFSALRARGFLVGGIEAVVSFLEPSVSCFLGLCVIGVKLGWVDRTDRSGDRERSDCAELTRRQGTEKIQY